VRLVLPMYIFALKMFMVLRKTCHEKYLCFGLLSRSSCRRFSDCWSPEKDAVLLKTLVLVIRCYLVPVDWCGQFTAISEEKNFSKYKPQIKSGIFLLCKSRKRQLPKTTNFENVTLVARHRKHYRGFRAICWLPNSLKGVLVHKNLLASCQQCRHNFKTRQ